MAVDVKQIGAKVEKESRFLEKNYKLLVNSEYNRLLEWYKHRSFVLGKSVTIVSDDPTKEMEEIAKGKVNSIGDNLELFIDNCNYPISKGRLILN